MFLTLAPVLAAGAEGPPAEAEGGDDLHALAKKAIEGWSFKEFTPAVEARLTRALTEDRKQPDGSLADLAAWRQLARFFGQVATLRPDQERTLDWLIDRPALRVRVLLAADPNGDDPAEVIEALGVLQQAGDDKDAAKPEDWPDLAAALAVVWDDWEHTGWPWQGRGMAPSELRSAEHLKMLWKHYTAGPERVRRTIRPLPWDLAIFAVGIRVTKEEIDWALKNLDRYDPVVRVYGRVRNNPRAKYTDNTLRGGTTDYKLDKIAADGGKPADRAYVAVQGSRIFGRPAVTVAARQADRPPYAWVGVIDVGRRRSEWSFALGQPRGRGAVNGDVLDPQTGKRIVDGQVALTAPLALTPAADRLASMAIVRSLDLVRGPEKLALLDRAMKLSPGNRYAWAALPAAAKGADAETVAGLLERLENLAGTPAGDYAGRLSLELTGTLPPEARLKFLQRLERTYRRNADVTARIALARAAAYRDDGKEEKAIEAYTEAIGRFYKIHGIAVEAIDRLQPLMAAEDRQGQYLKLLYGTMRRLPKPATKAGYDNAGWTVLGKKLQALLNESGNEAAAEKIATGMEEHYKRLK